jgi:hypothetical protein
VRDFTRDEGYAGGLYSSVYIKKEEDQLEEKYFLVNLDFKEVNVIKVAFSTSFQVI